MIISLLLHLLLISTSIGSMMADQLKDLILNLDVIPADTQLAEVKAKFSQVGPVQHVFQKDTGGAFLVFVRKNDAVVTLRDHNNREWKGSEIKLTRPTNNEASQVQKLIDQESEGKVDLGSMTEAEINALLSRLELKGLIPKRKPEEPATPVTPSGPGVPHSTPNHPSFSFAAPVFHKTPKITSFSGEGTDEEQVIAEFESWRYEVDTLLSNQAYTSEAVVLAVRRSLKGKASRQIKAMPKTATVAMILEKLQGSFGPVVSGESIMQQFYNSAQELKESLASWGGRLEDLFDRAVELKVVDISRRDDMLKKQFFNGLANQGLQVAMRHKLESKLSFEMFLREARATAQELAINKPSASGKRHVVNQVQQAAKKDDNLDQGTLDEVLKRITQLEDRISGNTLPPSLAPVFFADTRVPPPSDVSYPYRYQNQPRYPAPSGNGVGPGHLGVPQVLNRRM